MQIEVPTEDQLFGGGTVDRSGSGYTVSSHRNTVLVCLKESTCQERKFTIKEIQQNSFNKLQQIDNPDLFMLT